MRGFSLGYTESLAHNTVSASRKGTTVQPFLLVLPQAGINANNPLLGLPRRGFAVRVYLS